MKLRNVLLAATVIALPVAVKAQPVTGLYVAGGAGYDYLTETNINSASITTPSGNNYLTTPLSGLKLEDSGGWVGLASVGYGLGNGLRVEIEGNYRQEHTHINQNVYVAGGGNLRTYGGMVNALYDFSLGLPVTPYVGVGVGYGWHDLQAFNVYHPGTAGNLQVNTTTSGGLAAQGIVGVAYNIAAIPGLALTAEARVYDDFTSGRVGTQRAPSATTVTFKLDDQLHVSGLLGLRFAFNAAPPPPPPAPAPAPAPVAGAARSYLVFFDWDRADLTARAKQVIAEAAQNSTHVQYTRIEVNGYTDTSGTPAYNQRLSVRRADSVKAELVHDGVPANVIDEHGYGETHLLVQTGPGVREPQNRRVEIIYH